MKRVLTVLFVICFITNSFAQSRIEKSEEKWDVRISYPQIQEPSNAAEKRFNEIVKQRYYSERDKFISNLNVPDIFKDYEFTYELYDSVMYSDNSFISVCCSGWSVYHNVRILAKYSFSINYDLENNKEVLLSDVYSNGYLEVLSDYCIKELVNQNSVIDPKITSNNSMIVDCAGPLEKNYRAFNLTKDGLLISLITYSPVNVLRTPIHSRVMVPYSLLKGYLKPDIKISLLTK